MVVVPGWARTRSSSASQRWLNWWMGLTGTAWAAAPGTRATCGVEPVLMEHRSYGTGGRLRHSTLPDARSMPMTSSR
jgi:hypothetical protein